MLIHYRQSLCSYIQGSLFLFRRIEPSGCPKAGYSRNSNTNWRGIHGTWIVSNVSLLTCMIAPNASLGITPCNRSSWHTTALFRWHLTTDLVGTPPLSFSRDSLPHTHKDTPGCYIMVVAMWLFRIGAGAALMWRDRSVWKSCTDRSLCLFEMIQIFKSKRFETFWGNRRKYWSVTYWKWWGSREMLRV